MNKRLNLKTTWITKAGVPIHISKMEDSHLTNTIALLRCKAGDMKEMAIGQAMQAACCMQGEMAVMSVESDIHHLSQLDDEEFLEEFVPQWECLLKEEERRKLNKALEPAAVNLGKHLDKAYTDYLKSRL